MTKRRYHSQSDYLRITWSSAMGRIRFLREEFLKQVDPATPLGLLQNVYEGG